MAYDKVIDSATVEAGLTQIADAIREKSGTSGLLGFPTAMAAAIAAIQTGGGMASPINFDLSVGTFIVAEEVTTLNIQCDFPVKSTDSFAIFYAGFPIGERTIGCNISGYCVYNMPSAALPADKYCLFGYASASATKLSTNTSTSYMPVLPGESGTTIPLRGYGAWEFAPCYEYIWCVVKEKSA